VARAGGCARVLRINQADELPTLPSFAWDLLANIWTN
jgi:hypothetical protein